MTIRNKEEIIIDHDAINKNSIIQSEDIIRTNNISNKDNNNDNSSNNNAVEVVNNSNIEQIEVFEEEKNGMELEDLPFLLESIL